MSSIDWLREEQYNLMKETYMPKQKKKFNEIFQVGEPAPDFTGSYKPPTEEEEDDKMKFEHHLSEIDAVEKLKYKK